MDGAKKVVQFIQEAGGTCRHASGFKCTSLTAGAHMHVVTPHGRRGPAE